MSKTQGPQSVSLGGGGTLGFHIGGSWILLHASKHPIGKNPEQSGEVRSKFMLGAPGEKGNELWSETDLYNTAEVMATLRTSVSLSVKGDTINP